MNLPYTITIPGKLRAWQRARRNGSRYFTSHEMSAAKNEVAWAAKAIRAPLLSGPVELDLLMVIEPPKSWSKTTREAALAGYWYPTAKPDLDNVVKLIGDALNGIAWHDDAQIVSVVACKRYGQDAHAVIAWGPVPACGPAEQVFTGIST